MTISLTGTAYADLDDIRCDDCIIGTDVKTIVGHSDNAVKTVKISSVNEDTTHLYVEVDISNDVQTLFVYLYTNEKILLSTAEKDVWGETKVEFLLDLNEYDQYIFEKNITLEVAIGTNINHLIPYYITTENPTETDITEQIPQNSGGSSNDWMKKPTFGKSWNTNAQIVENGFSFNGYTLDITDNWHTDFEKTNSIIGETNHVEIKVYTDRILKTTTLLLGVPEIGKSSMLKLVFMFC